MLVVSFGGFIHGDVASFVIIISILGFEPGPQPSLETSIKSTAVLYEAKHSGRPLVMLKPKSLFMPQTKRAPRGVSVY